ncbi:MAG: hypothetical protein IJ339_06875, partial [Oscillospiraceae bacterium]|nr:hypothetical protein [Oscillospiraceae bacterium]
NAIVQDIIDINTDNAFEINFDKKLEKTELIKGRYYIRIPKQINGWEDILADIADSKTLTETDIIVTTSETTPARVHRLFEKSKEIFIARFA